jgi:hypothetical protein
VKKALLGLMMLLFVATIVPAQPPQGGLIAGRIMEDGTSNGIYWAAVTATRIQGDPFERTTQSGWNGQYVIHHLPPGPYVVTAHKLGWSDGVYPDTLMVNDDVHEGIDIYLTEVPIEYGSIAGVISDAVTSDPIENAYVIVRGPGFWNTHYAQTGAPTWLTNWYPGIMPFPRINTVISPAIIPARWPSMETTRPESISLYPPSFPPGSGERLPTRGRAIPSQAP